MMISGAILAAIAILPSDRMAMANRRFNKGDYETARSEYRALAGESGIDAEELMYCLAECERLTGDKSAARKAYGELLEKAPLSKYAHRARLMMALCAEGRTRMSELKLLDSDAVPAQIRASALFHLGTSAKDADALDRCVKTDPNGPYALHAKFARATILADDSRPEVRRQAVGLLHEVSLSQNKELARDAAYFAAVRSYSDKRYDEAATLLRKYMKNHPGDEREKQVRTMAAWSEYLLGRYSDSARLCGSGGSDDLAYLKAACAYSTGDYALARTLMKEYLDAYPSGKYRKSVELPLARMDFADAEKSSDAARTLEAAKLSASLSNTSQDRLRLAWAYEKGGHSSEAYSAYSAVAKDFPGTEDAAEALFRKAMMDMRAGRWSPAELALSEAMAANPQSQRRAESMYWRGIAAIKLGHSAEGVKMLENALEAGLSLDQSREARLNIADAVFAEGGTAKAKEMYAKLVDEGAAARMSASKLRNLGRFLLECPDGEPAFAQAKKCAAALEAVADTPEWRQAAYALMGAAEEADGEYMAAIGSYRQAMAENVRTAESRKVALNLGILLSRNGSYNEADQMLKEAVKLNASNPGDRAQAYLWLAKNCEADGDVSGACGYATVISSLFDDPEVTAEAEKILEAHPGEADR